MDRRLFWAETGGAVMPAMECLAGSGLCGPPGSSNASSLSEPGYQSCRYRQTKCRLDGLIVASPAKSHTMRDRAPLAALAALDCADELDGDSLATQRTRPTPLTGLPRNGAFYLYAASARSVSAARS